MCAINNSGRKMTMCTQWHHNTSNGICVVIHIPLFSHHIPFLQKPMYAAICLLKTGVYECTLVSSPDLYMSMRQNYMPGAHPKPVIEDFELYCSFLLILTLSKDRLKCTKSGGLVIHYLGRKPVMAGTWNQASGKTAIGISILFWSSFFRIKDK